MKKPLLRIMLVLMALSAILVRFFPHTWKAYLNALFN